MTSTDAWCILRTSGRLTLPLAESLACDGFEVWTPVETRTVQISRMNVNREVRNAILPSFIFAAWEHRFDLLGLASSPGRMRRFSVFRYAERIPMVADDALIHLRRMEKRLTPRQKANRTWAKGALVKVKSCADARGFDAMTGIVRKSDCEVTVVCFSAWFDKVEIPTSILVDDGAYEFQSATDTAARKAA